MTRTLPGLGLAAAATVVLLAGTAALSAAGVSALSPLVLALVAGAVVGSLLGRARRAANHGGPGDGGGDDGGRAGRFAARVAPGTAWVARVPLRLGVVLLGFQLALPDLLALGWRGLAVVLVTVTVTFAGTLALGRLLRVPRTTTLLVATGFSICGAAAVSAMTGVLERRPGSAQDAGLREGVAAALALVTVYGTLAIVVLPALAGPLGLDDEQAGLWIGASVQEVAQVVAAAGTVSAAALATATVAKLARVVLLAPLVAGAGVVLSRRSAAVEPAGTHGAALAGRRRRALPVPGFVLGFLAAVAVSSLGVVPPAALGAAEQLQTVLFTAAMFALGLGVDVPHLARTGRRPLLLGALSAVVVTGVSLAAVLALTS